MPVPYQAEGFGSGLTVRWLAGWLSCVTMHSMNVYNVTIPKALSRMGDLVLVPRKEYESFLEFKKIREYIPTKAQKRALVKAELNFKKGKSLSYDEFATKLGFKN